MRIKFRQFMLFSSFLALPQLLFLYYYRMTFKLNPISGFVFMCLLMYLLCSLIVIVIVLRGNGLKVRNVNVYEVKELWWAYVTPIWSLLGYRLYQDPDGFLILTNYSKVELRRKSAIRGFYLTNDIFVCHKRV